VRNRATRIGVAGLVMTALLGGAAGCGMFQRPDAKITGVQLQDVQPTHATMRFDVEVENPYAVPLPMSNVDYALSSEGQQFLAGRADVQGSVPAGGRKTLGVPVRINFVELVRAVSGARPGQTIPYAAELGLSVDVPALGPLRVPMTRQGELTIPTAADLLDRLRDLAR